jgi:hypothetical protein
LSETNHPLEAEIEKANSSLTAGLKACRSILSDYRAMMAGEESAGGVDHVPPNAET